MKICWRTTFVTLEHNMSNILNGSFPCNVPCGVIVTEAQKVVDTEYWGLDQYDMFIGYMSQFVDNATTFTYEQWAAIVLNSKVRRIT